MHRWAAHLHLAFHGEYRPETTFPNRQNHHRTAPARHIGVCLSLFDFGPCSTMLAMCLPSDSRQGCHGRASELLEMWSAFSKLRGANSCNRLKPTLDANAVDPRRKTQPAVDRDSGYHRLEMNAAP